MNNYLHKTKKGDLYMYDLIAIIYKVVFAIFVYSILITIFNL